MNIEQTSAVLARIQLIDHRVIDKTVVQDWHAMIGHLRFEDAFEAVALHRVESATYLLPHHIVAGAKRIAAARHDAEGPQQIGGRSGKVHPRPNNFDAMTRAWNDPVEFARQVAIYNAQLQEAGFPPVYEPVDGLDGDL